MKVDLNMYSSLMRHQAEQNRTVRQSQRGILCHILYRSEMECPVGLLVWCLKRRSRSKSGGLQTPFKKQRKGGSTSTSSSDSPTAEPPTGGPLKTDVVTYSTYRQQRLTDIRGSVGLAGDPLLASPSALSGPVSCSNSLDSH